MGRSLDVRPRILRLGMIHDSVAVVAPNIGTAARDPDNNVVIVGMQRELLEGFVGANVLVPQLASGALVGETRHLGRAGLVPSLAAASSLEAVGGWLDLASAPHRIGQQERQGGEEGEDDVPSTASEWAFITKNGELASVVDLAFGIGLEIIDLNR